MKNSQLHMEEKKKKKTQGLNNEQIEKKKN